MSDIRKALHDCVFFSQVAESSLKRLAGMAVKKRYPKGKLIFRQGDDVPGVFIIVAGKVRVYNIAPNGKEHVLHLLGPGETFAEIAALGEFPCPAFAETLAETTCLLLPTQPFNQALRCDHQLCLQILFSLAAWTRYFVGLLEGIVLRDAAGRVASYLLEAERVQGRIISLPGFRKHVASHLNLTSETWSRTLRQMRDEGLVAEKPRNRLEIRNRVGLQRLAEGFFPKL